MRGWLRAVAGPAVVCGTAGVQPALACSVCFGEASGPMIEGARLGVFLLFGLTLFVQGAFVAFFVQLYRRSRRFQRRERLRSTLKVVEGGR